MLLHGLENIKLGLWLNKMTTKLYEELTTDPLNLGYAPHVLSRNDAAIGDLLNALNYTQLSWISTTNFNKWCALESAEYANIESLAASQSSPYFGAANALLRGLSGSNPMGAFNLADAQIMGLFNVWPFVDTTGASKSFLISLGTIPASRSQILGIDGSADAVSFTLNTLGMQ